MTDLGAALQQGGFALWGLGALLFVVGVVVGVLLQRRGGADEEETP